LRRRWNSTRDVAPRSTFTAIVIGIVTIACHVGIAAACARKRFMGMPFKLHLGVNLSQQPPT